MYIPITKYNVTLSIFVDVLSVILFLFYIFQISGSLGRSMIFLQHFSIFKQIASGDIVQYI